ncbi:hypothetical protein [Leptospira brenneri]|uniref:ATP-grasp domain-containing protein n=1 Tax=Leptospira brenneri TaxID=2023182 RepID=A0A2M9Y4X8_9LEPT|nr:hypothetical protein [Leptospira brenneri]PJZ46634.1 hypothetical protein CH361_06060 [Leptospira brenneri]TGK96745.1 hypothetical protein EHQ30_09160 [Leptospira brenneri]
MFFPISREEDFILVEELPSEELYSHWKDSGFTPGTPHLEGGLLGEVNLLEWGCRNEWYEGRLVEDPIRTETSRYLNSKITQLDFRKNHSPLPAKVISSEEHLFAELEEVKLPIVLKSEFGLAGRNHIIFKSPSDSWKMSQVNKRLFGFPVVAESWVGEERFFDFSTLWDVNDGEFFYLTSTAMLVDKEGVFRGIRIGGSELTFAAHFLPPVMDLVRDTKGFIPKEYSGPCAIDGFLFREEGRLQIQPVSEFNFRYSIGRILWEVRKKRNPKPEVVSGILILPYPKQGSLEEWSTIKRLEKELEISLILLTPVRDLSGKPYQNAVVYFETKEENEPSVVESIWQSWMD